MSWKEHDRLVKKFGIERASTEDLRRAGVFGTTFVRGGPLSVRLVHEHAAEGLRHEDDDDGSGGSAARRRRNTPRPERGEDPETCPFTETDAMFGQGNVVEVTHAVLSDLLDGRYGDRRYLDGIAHLLDDRRRYSDRELNEGPRGLITRAAVSRAPSHRVIDRSGPVSIRRRSNGSIVISRRGHASEPIQSEGRLDGTMRIHRVNPRRDEAEVFDEDCICLTKKPFTRWLVEGEAAERLEEALRRTDEIIELGVWGARATLMNATWLIGRARGRGAALWPTAENMLSARPATGSTIDAGDCCVADEIRRELVRINRDYGIEVPGRYHGDLDPASAWELLREARRRRKR
jgi:hypothetical protein